MRSNRGFTLLEVMVATVIMAVAITGLMSGLSGSMRNAAKLTSHDQATLLARQKMDELIATNQVPRNTVLEGPFEARNGGWRARVTPFEFVPNPAAGFYVLDRIELEVWWVAADNVRRTSNLEGYRKSVLTQDDITSGVLLGQTGGTQ